MQDIDRFGSDDFINILRAFSEDAGLRRWFLSLQDVSENVRISTLGTMVSKMKANKEDPGLISEFASLMSPDVYSVAVKTILTCKNSKDQETVLPEEREY